MDVWQITLAVLRRWYVFVPLLALAGGAAYVAGEGIQPEYEVTGAALVVPGTADASVPNPYGGRDQANAVVGIVLNSLETRTQVESEGLAPAYDVSSESRTNIMNVSVRAADPHVGIATATRVYELAAQELAARQGAAGMSAASQYGLDILAEPSVANVVYDGKRQVQAVVGVLGAAGALLVAVLFDDIVGLYRRRRAKRLRRRRGRDLEGSPDHPPQDAEPSARERDVVPA